MTTSIMAPIKNSAPPATTAAPPPEHIPILDGLRGLAILMVIFYHWSVSAAPMRTHGLLKQILPLFSSGIMGVDLFFVLSGFLITGILLRVRSTEGGLKKFYARRALRIFPLYYAVLLIALVILPEHFRETALRMPAHVNRLPLWFYCSNIAETYRGWIFGSLDHFWSLAIEEQYYLIWPWVVFLVPRRGLGWFCAGVVTLSILSRVFFYQSSYMVAAYLFPLCRLDGLAIGSLLAVTWADGWLHQGRTKAIIAGTLTALAAGLCMDYCLPLVNAAFKFTFFSLVFAGLLALAVTNQKSPLARILDNSFLRFFGLYSYGLYVIHHIFREPLIPTDIIYPLSKPNAAAISFGIVYLAISLAVAMMSYHLWEKPFLKLKKHFQ